MIHISLFSGIGGFEYAAQQMGWRNLASCERNEFCQTVLRYHYPEAYHHDDVDTLTYKILNDELTKRFGDWRTDDVILTGGFPCQPYSTAGKRQGKDDERHKWPQMLRIIQEVKPTFVVGENVRGLINWNGGVVFDEVQADLEAAGYEVWPFLLPAAGVNAPHERYRIWFVAHSINSRAGGFSGKACGQKRESSKDWGKSIRQAYWKIGSSWNNTASENGLTENTLCNGCVRGEPDQNGTEDGQLRNVGSGNCIRFRRAKVAGIVADTQKTNCKLTSCTWSGWNGFAGMGNDGATSDTKGIRMERNQPDWKQEPRTPIESEVSGRNGSGNDWSNFPTQSPVLSRNDGISTRLDGITFSKWRKESIQAAGNAIVSQVALQIFKAIERLRHLHNPRKGLIL